MGTDAGDAAADPKFLAAIDFCERMGAESTQIRYDDEQNPIVWVAVAVFKRDDGLTFDCAAAGEPVRAMTRLVEQLSAGGRCAHCGKPSAATDEWDAAMPGASFMCWHVYDPETKTYRRSCEGETTGRAFVRDPKTGRPHGRNDLCPCGSGKKVKRCHGA